MKRIIVKNVSKKFNAGFKKRQSVLQRAATFFSGREPKKIIDALKDISLDIEAGEIIGIIGPNGSGKSTLLRIISGIYNSDSGTIKTNGNVISLINLGVGLKERLTMEQNIFLVGSLFGLSNAGIKRAFNEIINFSGLQNFVNTKIYQFSSGMVQRLVFSIAVHAQPDILLLDEVFEVGDEDFKEKSALKIKEIVERGGCVVLVSHDMEMVNKYCSKVILMDKGQLIKSGRSDATIKEYLSSQQPNEII